MASRTPSASKRSGEGGLRERTRQVMRDEVAAVAMRLFDEQGFAGTTVEQITAEAGVSRATFFRYFGTKEDVVLGSLEQLGRHLAVELSIRPFDEPLWESLRRAFEVITTANADAPEKSLNFLRMLSETPSLRARHWGKQQAWQGLLVPEVARRMSADSTGADPRPSAIVAAALACLDASTAAWLACDGSIALSDLLDQAMGAVG